MENPWSELTTLYLSTVNLSTHHDYNVTLSPSRLSLLSTLLSQLNVSLHYLSHQLSFYLSSMYVSSFILCNNNWRHQHSSSFMSEEYVYPSDRLHRPVSSVHWITPLHSNIVTVDLYRFFFFSRSHCPAMEVLDLSMRKKCCPLLRSSVTSDKGALSPLTLSPTSPPPPPPSSSPSSLQQHKRTTTTRHNILSSRSDEMIFHKHSMYSSVKSSTHGHQRHSKQRRSEHISTCDKNKRNETSDNDDIDDDDDDNELTNDIDDEVENEINSLMTVAVTSPPPSTASSSSSPIIPVKGDNCSSIIETCVSEDYLTSNDNRNSKCNQRIKSNQLLKQHVNKLRHCSLNNRRHEEDQEHDEDESVQNDHVKCSNGSSKYTAVNDGVQVSNSDRPSIKVSSSSLKSPPPPPPLPVPSSSRTLSPSTVSPSPFHSHLQQRMNNVTTSQQLAAAAALTQLLSNSGLISPHLLSSVNAASLVNHLTANNSQNLYHHNGTLVNSNSSCSNSSSISSSSLHRPHNSSSLIVNCSSPSTQHTLTPFDGNLLPSIPWDLLTNTWRNHNWHTLSSLKLPQHSTESPFKCKTNTTGNALHSLLQSLSLYWSTISRQIYHSHTPLLYSLHPICKCLLTLLLVSSLFICFPYCHSLDFLPLPSLSLPLSLWIISTQTHINKQQLNSHAHCTLVLMVFPFFLPLPHLSSVTTN